MTKADDIEIARRLPLACALGPDDGHSRMLRWQRLHAVGSPVVTRRGAELEVRYQPGPGVAEELFDLAAAEAQCCPFVTWIATADGQPVLRVIAPPDNPEAIAPIAALFDGNGAMA